jgi:hypothetical protein
MGVLKVASPDLGVGIDQMGAAAGNGFAVAEIGPQELKDAGTQLEG